MALITKYSGYKVIDHENWRIKEQHVHVEQAKVDDNDVEDLMKANCDLALCERYFKSKPTTSERKIEIGKKYRHFKEGKIVEVIAISQDTESPGSFYVVYECKDKDNMGKVWSRPYDMFASPTDKEKYPGAEQYWRFEEVE